MSTTLDPREDVVVAERPVPGPPRSYEFPAVAMDRLSNGLTVLIADLPGRPLVSATVVVRGGAALEPAADAGSTVLAARPSPRGPSPTRPSSWSRRPSDSAHRSTPMPVGTPSASASTSRPPGSARRSSSSPRSSCGRPSRNPRWSGFATSASTTCCRPRRIHDAGPSRHSPPRSTRPRRPTTGRPAGPARPSSASRRTTSACLRAGARPAPRRADRGR